ncbi:MAG TPA: hypothetical protein VEA80_03535 [Vitreimonas sp.]|uniref:hypothetical protein n=1 Tax=Vitreimonas sp. TaxID=3069702 RepID=UPI002D65996D|nr:hypothetical protein [Vitreimonas sp.]HYD86521.1 hypothetical protein [Vitreimonas sp.]
MTFYKFGVGVVLAAVMIAVLVMGALVFSARDFQFGVQQLSPQTGGMISFEKLERANAGIDEIEAATSGPRGEARDLANQLAGLDAQIQTLTNDADEARAAIVGAIAEIERNANIQAASAAVDTSARALTQRVNSLAARQGLSPTDQQRVAQLRAQAQQLTEQEAALDERDAERAALVARQRLVNGQVQEADRRVLALQASVVPETDQYARVRGEAEALQSMSPFGVSAHLAQGHPALLSSALVLLMGSLGALLYLFPAYLTRPAPVTIAEIIVRVIFGMCAALAFYVLANAAITGFAVGSTTAAAATTSASLNPFTVSLVGIVAGVMSEDIAKWIQERGRGFLQQGGRPATAGAPASAPAAGETAPGGGLVNNQAISN